MTKSVPLENEQNKSIGNIKYTQLMYKCRSFLLFSKICIMCFMCLCVCVCEDLRSQNILGRCKMCKLKPMF